MSIGLITFLIMFAIVFLCRIPIPYGILSIGVVYFVVTGGNVGIVANNVLNTYCTNYVIIAVPLFIFSANVMNTGKITGMLFRFADGLVGRYRGGIAYVNVIASLIFSGMTGSAIADASGLGVWRLKKCANKDMTKGSAPLLPPVPQPLAPFSHPVYLCCFMQLSPVHLLVRSLWGGCYPEF